MEIKSGFKIFHTLFSVAFFLKKDVKERVKRFGISEAEARFLFFIGLNGGEVKVHDFVHFFGKHKSTIRQKLLLLEEKELIQFQVCTFDRREKKVLFTKKGKQLFQEILKINTSYQEKIFYHFSEEERETLLFLLNKLLENHKKEIN